MDWQGFTVEREIHPLTIEEGAAEIDHHHHEVRGDHRSPRAPISLQESPAIFSTQSQRSLRSPSGDGSEARTPVTRTILPLPDKYMLPLKGGDTSEQEGECLVGTQIPVIVIGILSLWFQKCHPLMGGRRKGLMTPSPIGGFSSPS